MPSRSSKEARKGPSTVRKRKPPVNTVRRGRGPTANKVVQPRVTEKVRPPVPTVRRGRGPTAGRKEQPVLAPTAGGSTKVVSRKRYRKAIREQREDAADRRALARYRGYRSLGDYNRGNRATAKPEDLKVAGINVDRLTGKAGRAAIDVLEETTRPTYGIAGGTRAAIRGEDIAKAVSRGLSKQDRYTFSDVLKEAGVENKAVRGVAGFGLDVALDPTTYVSLGTASVAKNAGLKAAKKTLKRRVKQRVAGELAEPAVKKTDAAVKTERKTYRKARAQGKTPAEARQVASKRADATNAARQQRRARVLDTRAARRSERRVAAKAPEGQGLRVGFGRTSATVPVAKSLREEPTRVSRAVREIGTTFSPHVRPAGVSTEQFRAIKGATREARAAAATGRARAIARAAAFAKAIPPERASEVIDAIERGVVYTLPKGLQAPARAIERELKAARKAEVKAGIGTAQVSNARYFTHLLDEALDDAAGGSAGGVTIKAGYGKTRKHRGTIAQIEARGGPKFSKDIPKVVADRLSRSASDVAKADLAKAVAEAGRKVTAGKDVRVKVGEGVFEIAAGKVRQLDLDDAADKRLLSRVANGEVEKTLVVLNEELVKRQVKGVAPGAERTIVGRAGDKVTGGFKFLATVPNPGFHFRNLYGDAQNAYLAQSAPKLARSTGTAARTLRRVHRAEEGARTVAGSKRALGHTIRVKDRYGRTQELSLEVLGREAEKAGAIRQGFMQRELPELWRADEGQVTAVRTGKAARAGRSVARAFQSREDLMRLATYIGARREGLNAREAADRMARHHFDYGDLSPFERNVMRRLLPFYTFTSRNIPLQSKALLQRPGKFANVQKAREEVAKAQGIDLEEFEGDLREFQLRGVPVPIRLGGEVFAVSTALPLADLNELPIPRNGDFAAANMREWRDKFTSMLNPLIRTPIEWATNYNFFFRSDIERDNSPLVAAPSFVTKLPADVQERFGIVPDYLDKRSGKKVPGWPAKVDYAVKVLLPGPPGAVLRLSEEGESRRGQGTGAKAMSYVAGIKADRVDPETAQIDALFKRHEALSKQRGALSQRGIGSAEYGKRETPEYRRVKNELKRVEETITRLSAKRGDAKALLESTRSKGPADPLGLRSADTDTDPLSLRKKQAETDPLGLAE